MKTTAFSPRKALCVLLAAAIAISLAPSGLASPGAFADDAITDKPTGVDGRILTAAEAGDKSDWVEIAQNGGYSLIVRANYINLSGFHYGEYAWQYTAFGTTTAYKSSTLRDKINNWFNSYVPVAIGGVENDILPKGARLREYSVMSDAASVLGTSCNPVKSLADGFSKPTDLKASAGNDVAFALSYCESANFLSELHFVRERAIANQPSSEIAVSNYSKISIPNAYQYNMWLRNPGDIANTVGALACEYGAFPGRLFQIHITPGNTYSYGLVYPALWVESTIFKPDSFTVSYRPNGGSGSENDYGVDAGTTHIVADQGYTMDGFEFKAWNTEPDGTGIPYSNGDAILVDDDIKLFAQWTPLPPTYGVTYDPNGGTGSINTYLYDANTYHHVFDQGYSRDGYGIIAWNTNADGTGIVYLEGDTILMVEDVYLYAQWAQEAYTVTYHPNGGTGSMNAFSAKAKDSYVVANQGYYWDGHDFIGWNTSADGSGKAYYDGDPIMADENIDLYAQWAVTKPVYYCITYHPNGGTGSDMPYMTLPNSAHRVRGMGYSMDGFSFDCWNTEPDGTGIPYENGDYILMASDIDLYAQWEPNAAAITITYKANGGIGDDVVDSGAGGIFTIMDNMFGVPSYMEFDCWSTEPGVGGVIYYDGDVIAPTGSLVLYAQWLLKAI